MTTPTTDPPPVRFRFRVRGRVQGVGFRAFVQREASLLGISGWVRNTWDGDVDGEAEGPRERLLEFQDRLRQGPPGSFVSGCVFEPTAPRGTREPFRITREI